MVTGDPAGAGSRRVLADATQPQPEGGAEQHDPHHRHEQERQIAEQRRVEEGVPEHRDVRQQRERVALQPDDGRILEDPAEVEELGQEESGEADGEQVDGDTDHDRIPLAGDVADRKEARRHHPGGHRGKHSEVGVASDVGHGHGGEGTEEHGALEGDLEHAGSLADEPADGGEQDRHRGPGDRVQEGGVEQLVEHQTRTAPGASGATCPIGSASTVATSSLGPRRRQRRADGTNPIASVRITTACST